MKEFNVYKTKKDKGFILLETIIFLMLISYLAVLLNKIIINNLKKAEVLIIKEDIRTLSRDYEELMQEGTIYINSNSEIIENIKNSNSNDSNENNKFFYKYAYKKDKKKELIISNEGLYIQEKIDNNIKISGLIALVKEQIVLKPHTYKTDFINQEKRKE